MKLHTLLCALLAGAALAAAEKALPVTPETYQPDFFRNRTSICRI